MDQQPSGPSLGSRRRKRRQISSAYLSPRVLPRLAEEEVSLFNYPKRYIQD